MADWSETDLTAHIAFRQDLDAELTAAGELADSQGLGGPAMAKVVASDGSGPPVVTDGLFPEFKEVLAGYRLVDVDDESRAVEIAARMSAAPRTGWRAGQAAHPGPPGDGRRRRPPVTGRTHR